VRRIPGAVSLSRGAMALRMLIDWLGDGNFGAVLYLRLYLHHMVGEGRRMYKALPPPPARNSSPTEAAPRRRREPRRAGDAPMEAFKASTAPPS